MDAFEWLRAVQRRSTLSPQARAIAAVLAVRMDPDGSSCYPSLDTIAADASYANGRSVVRWLDELERGGWVIRYRRPHRTYYYATIPLDDPAHMPPHSGGDRAGDSPHDESVTHHTMTRPPQGPAHEKSKDPRAPTPSAQVPKQEHRSSGSEQRAGGWRDPPPDDPYEVLPAYRDNPYMGGRRLAVIGLDHAEAHEFISLEFGHDDPEARACYAGFDDAGGRRVPDEPAVERDPIFLTLVEVCGCGHETGWDVKLTGIAAAQLREVGASPEDVRARADVYRRLWPDCPLTPLAMANNYCTLGANLPEGAQP